MRIFKNLRIFLIFAFTIQSCMSPLTEKDNGRTVELEDNSSFEINLKAEPGMVWKVVNYDKNMINPPQIEITDMTNDSGQPVKEFSFLFTTQGSGESLVTLDYLEKNDSTHFPHKTFEVKIICGTMGRIESN